VTLVEKIAAAFSVEPIPSGPLVELGYLDPANQGDYGATAYFSGKPWNALDAESLRFHADAMYMFTPLAHQYYLPAFMVASLSDPKVADVIPDNIIFHLSQHEDKFWWERILALTPSQREVVAEFVEAVADIEIDRPKIAAVFAGFSQAAQMPNKSLERTRDK
jgi:hypothetical protein